jgi:hypothetical protein
LSLSSFFFFWANPVVIASEVVYALFSWDGWCGCLGTSFLVAFI